MVLPDPSLAESRDRPGRGPASSRALPASSGLDPASAQARPGRRPYRSYVGMKAMGRVAVKAGLKRSVRAMPSMSRATGRPSR